MNRKIFVFIVIFCLPVISQAGHRDENMILPLSIIAGVGSVAAHEIGDTKFGYSRLIEIGTLYRLYHNLGMGVGFNLMSRNFTYQGTSDEYSIDTLFTQILWHPRYDMNGWGYYIGAKGNIHVILFGQVGGLDSGDKDAVTWGVEPVAGLLLPMFYPHVFLDLSLSYQFREFPSLYHEPASSRETHVNDSNLILQARIRF